MFAMVMDVVLTVLGAWQQGTEVVDRPKSRTTLSVSTGREKFLSECEGAGQLA
jgi:hypothetical protein